MTLNQIESLIHRSQQNDEKAFRQLVVEYQPLVFRLSFRLLQDEDEAKDVVQETFIKVWLHLHKYQCHFKFSTWIYKIACNICYDRLRTIKRSREKIQTDVDWSTLHALSNENIESSMINRELKDLISNLTSQLTAKQKLVFTLRDIEELELDEIKMITGMSNAKIKSNLYLARQYIRNRINEII